MIKDLFILLLGMSIISAFIIITFYLNRGFYG